MAEHINDVKSSNLQKVSKEEFYENIRPWDLFFCSGAKGISVPIERETNSCLSHVGHLWTMNGLKGWATAESTFPNGVHFGNFASYMDGYDGDLILARRPALAQQQIEQELNVAFNLLGEGYNWIEEVSIATRKIRLFSKLPVLKPKNELYCSAEVQMEAMNTLPYRVDGPDWATPEQIYTDITVIAVCAYVRT